MISLDLQMRFAYAAKLRFLQSIGQFFMAAPRIEIAFAPVPFSAADYSA
jgi:hypothetical protein